MKIKNLKLLAFGKFHNKEINLNDGINLIYGENESGKSTTFSFIEGIFYGFAKNSLKRRIFENEFEKYRPWTGKDYRGILILEDNNKDIFRIERDFDKNKLSLLNLRSKEDLSDESSLREFTKIAQPGVYFFNVDSKVFKNTFFIGQLKAGLEEDSYNTLKEKLQNFIVSGDENFNVKEAINILENKINELGRESLSKSKIGLLNKNIEEVRKKINILSQNTLSYNKLKIRNKEINHEIENKKNQLEISEKVREQIDYNKINEKLLEIENLKNKTNLSTNIDIKIYKRAIELENQYKLLKERKESLENLNKTYRLEEDLETYNLIKEDISYVKDLQDRLYKLNEVNYSKEIDILTKDIKETKTEGKKYLLLILGSFLLIFLILIASIISKKYYINIISLFLLIYIYLRGVKYRLSKEVVLRLEDRIKTYREKSQAKTLEKKDIDRKLDKILEKYKKDSKEELDSYFSEKLDYINSKIIRSNLVEEELIKKEKEIEKINNALKNIEIEIKDICEKTQLKSLKELKDSFQDSLIEKDINNKISSIKLTIDHILDDRDLESLNHNIDVEKLEYDQLNTSLSKDINDLRIEEARISEQLKIEEKEIKKIQVLREEEEYLKEKLNEEIRKRDSIKRAIDKIQEISSDKKDNILDLIIDKINFYIEKITSGKYKKVNIDYDFNIKIFDDEKNYLIDLENLSNGTVDQIYLAFRISLLDILFEDMPIIIDDHFIQYDDKRLFNTLKFLGSLKRQIIIFSASKREKNILDKLGEDYNYIEMREV
ncbi:MAG: ATP-binding protein [Peptoniphilaceae bacterium]